MDKHEWTDEKGIKYVADAKDGGRLGAARPSLEEAPACIPDYADELHRQRAISGAAREILRLAEEVERLKGRPTNGEALAGRRSAAAAERARIKKELLEEMPAQAPEYLGSADYSKGWNAAARMADEVVRRILPEEG